MLTKQGWVLVNCFIAVTMLVTSSACAPLPNTTSTARFTVNSAADAHDANLGDGFCAAADGHCTLRAALEETAYTRYGGISPVTIALLRGTYVLTLAQLHLPNTVQGPPHTVSIMGDGKNTIVIDAGHHSRILEIDGQWTFELSGVTLVGGNATAQSPNSDGGILVRHDAGDVSLRDIWIEGNVAEDG